MKKSNLKKAAIIGICCTAISANTAFAVQQNPINNNILNLDEVIYQNRIIKAKDEIVVKYNGQILQMKGDPFIENNRTLVEISDIAEKLGAKTEINSQDKTIKIFKDNIKIELILHDKTAKVIKDIDGKSKEEAIKLDAAAKKWNDKYFVPIRFIAETFGAKVEWDNSNRVVLVADGAVIGVERPIEYTAADNQDIMKNKLLSEWYNSNYKTRGIYSVIDGDLMYILASAGEMTTGGYTLGIDSVTEVTAGTAYVHATLRQPEKGSIVTQVLTYPNKVIKFNKGNIEKVIWDLSEEKPQKDDAEESEIKNLVKEFGEKLQMVSLPAPKDIISKSIEENYGKFVSPELLKQWQANPEKAPGREVSSPWPDHINILSIDKISEALYEVNGEIIEVTSTEKRDMGVAAKRQIVLSVKKNEDKWLIDDVSLGNYNEMNSIIYENSDYGFYLSLPKSWRSFTVVKGKWEGISPDDSTKQNTNLSGEIINIRHPEWTKEKPRQDIPVMIFTVDQWKLLHEGKMNVGAAPILPTELGRNSKYVFALPARYNYAFPTGYEEVEKIIEAKPLQSFEI